MAQIVAASPGRGQVSDNLSDDGGQFKPMTCTVHMRVTQLVRVCEV